MALAALALSACSSKESAQKAETEVIDAEIVEVDMSYLPTDPGQVVNLNDDDLIRPNSKVDVLTILDFNAVWCGPCKAFTPVFHEAAEKFTNVRFMAVDVDNNPETAAAFGVESIPMVVLMRPDGQSVTYVGTGDILPAEKFEAIVNANL